MRRTIVCAVLMIAICAILFAGGQQEGQTAGQQPAPKTLTLLNIPEQMWEGFKAVIAEWEKRTGNKIEVQILPDDQMNPVLVQRLNAGEGPDIFMTNGKAAEFYLPPKSVEPLNNRSWVGDIPAAAMELMTYSDGTLPYVPLVPLNAAGIAYNKKIFRNVGIKEPVNRRDFVASCQKLKGAGYTALNFQGAPGASWNLRFWMDPYFAFYDKYYASPDHWQKLNSNRLQFADVDFYVEGLQQLRGYIESGFTNDDVLSTTFDMTKSRFAKSEVVMACVAEWIVGPVMSTTPDFEMGFFPLPVEDDREGVLATFIGFGISVWKNSKNKQTALEFIDFLCTKEMQELFYTLTPGTPIFPYAEVALTPVGAAIKEHVARGNASPRMMINDKLFLQPVYDKLLQSIASGDKTPKEILASYDGERQRAGKQRKVPGY